MSARGKNSRGQRNNDRLNAVAPVTEMPAQRSMSRDHTEHAGGDGLSFSDTHSVAAIPKKARKGVRRAKGGSITNERLPDAEITGHLSHGSDAHIFCAGSGIDQSMDVSHRENVDPAEIVTPKRRDRANRIAREQQALRGRGGYLELPRVLPETIAIIQSLHREHRAIQRARGDMDRRIKADERWFAVRRLRAAGEPLPPGKFPDVTKADQQMVIATRQRFFVIRDAIEAQRKACQKELLAQVKALPIMAWAGDVRGLGIASVAAIIGEAGDLGGYSNPGKLWKRMGLAVIDGKGQGKRSNAEEAAKHGYSPARRSEMHVVGDCLVRAGGPYADLYRTHKALQMEREGITKMHAHKRALRYIEKRLLRSMWQAWRGANTSMEADEPVPPASIFTPRKFTPAEIAALAGQLDDGTHFPVASQDGDRSHSATHGPVISVPPIPRKRVPRAMLNVKSSHAVSEAAD